MTERSEGAANAPSDDHHGDMRGTSQGDYYARLGCCEVCRRQALIDAYEAKVQDFAAETLRSSHLAAVALRLFDTLSTEYRLRVRDGDLHQSAIDTFWREGLPSDEFDALCDALDARESGASDWLREVRRG